MPFFYVNCPHCATELEVEDSYNGVLMVCPTCGDEFVPLMDAAVQDTKTEGDKPLPRMSKQGGQNEKQENAENKENAPAPFASPLDPESETSEKNEESEPENEEMFSHGDADGTPEENSIENNGQSIYRFGRFFAKFSGIAAILVLLCGGLLITGELLSCMEVLTKEAFRDADTGKIAIEQDIVRKNYSQLRSASAKLQDGADGAKIKELLETMPDELDFPVAPANEKDLKRIREIFLKGSEFEASLGISQPVGPPLPELRAEFRKSVRSLDVEIRILQDNIDIIRKEKTEAILNAAVRSTFLFFAFLLLAFLVPALGDYMRAGFDIAEGKIR